ncbi:adenylate/guanylate cyclase domain-containing protein [Thiospirochaeta perfilievii]|uniref:Adenylate/guanylate cyclase domain-containing protein n=1 Tax=Thiospirochaeta perfilievii TaxID=252967 RepID=A0A5C1QCT3_9SPIO|nr:adenylate/guanylate cyclase domain-containing protein [Thiospirochaeta perfilievii]QEN05217.1 adenylate/guanylate cyclase domain-containing protein [Thiospirochaeta perfilievii]
MKKLDFILGEKILGVRVTPLTLKIVFIFIILLLVSNFSSNYINLTLNRGQQLKLMNRLLVKDLKELHIFAMNQYEIYFFNQDLEGTIQVIIDNAKKQLTGEKSVAFGVNSTGEILFFASNNNNLNIFKDLDALKILNDNFKKNITEGTIEFNIGENEYFGIYKYHPRWNNFIIRGEEKNEFYRETQVIFYNVSIIIVILTIICAILGVYLIKRILRFVKIITKAIMEMQNSNKMDLISLEGASPDEITYLGAAINATSSTIDTLMNIFKKFVTKDVALKAYEEKQIRLEGSKAELTILFSDIKSFTFITEALGTDIIQLLNTHYDNTFKPIHNNDGIIGSIIGDALLAVFGTYKSNKNKSVQALDSGFKIQDETAKLREQMKRVKESLEAKEGGLTEVQEKVFHAVSLEVGVGIDGGEVFYGNIGSFSRMTNTVIGDNVNSSSRLEGLTRIYKVPIICSSYVKEEVENNSDKYTFVEIDQVFVKGKTQGKKVFWPLITENISSDLLDSINNFNTARDLYYSGDWQESKRLFKTIDLPICDEFLVRMLEDKPTNWSGIWSMTTK